MQMMTKEQIDTSHVATVGGLPISVYGPPQPAMQDNGTVLDMQGMDYSVVEPQWSRFIPVPSSHSVQEQIELDETRQALAQAEQVLRIQEERIRLLETLAMTDELTGLTNRRGFTAAFDRELTLACRDTNHAGFLVMVDLDGFKGINDRLGHQAGDAYLNAAALALQEGVRASDIVARLGGDEFVILFTNMDEDYAVKRLAKLQRFFNNRSMNWNGKRVPLRASFGAATYNGVNTAEAVMHLADMRLYAHKAHNKKQIAAS